MIKKRF